MRTSQQSIDGRGGLGIFAVMANAISNPGRHYEAPAHEDLPIEAQVRRSGVMERLDRWFWRQRQRDVEAYLSKASDVFGLEARIRTLGRAHG